MTVLLEYIDPFAKHIQISDWYSSSFIWYVHLIIAIKLDNIWSIMPKILCLRISCNSGIILSKLFTYYSQNYAGIIGTGLLRIQVLYFWTLGVWLCRPHQWHHFVAKTAYSFLWLYGTTHAWLRSFLNNWIQWVAFQGFFLAFSSITVKVHT